MSEQRANSTQIRQEQQDIIIIGAGPVGLAIAIWLLRDSNYKITLIDNEITKNISSQQHSRILALSHGSYNFLQNLGAWFQSVDFTKIYTVHVSQQAMFGRVLLRHSDYDCEALGYVVAYHDVLNSLSLILVKLMAQIDNVKQRFIWLKNYNVLNIHEKNFSIEIEIDNGLDKTKLRTNLVIHAHGGALANTQVSITRPLPLIINERAQSILSATVGCSAAIKNQAWERFTSNGPLALLPIEQRDNTTHFAVLWSSSSQFIKKLMEYSDSKFLAKLTEVFGLRMGQFIWVGQRSNMPLSTTSLLYTVANGQVAIGNAAQTLHPVGGQGLNLGLRDAWSLARSLIKRGFQKETMELFDRERKQDRYRTIGITEILARIFATEKHLIKCILATGIITLDMLPAIRSSLAKQLIFGCR